MLYQNLLPPNVPAKHMRRLMRDVFVGDPLIDECTPVLTRQLEGSGETFAPEFHGPFACLSVECAEIRCVAMRTDLLARYPLGFRAPAQVPYSVERADSLPVRLRDRAVDDTQSGGFVISPPNFDGYDDPAEYPPSHFDDRGEP